jgi:hypothetical protein
MKIKLEITKAGRRLHEGVYEIDDTTSFGAAWQDVWIKTREKWMAKSSSIGDLMDSIHDGVIDERNGAEIKMRKL